MDLNENISKIFANLFNRIDPISLSCSTMFNMDSIFHFKISIAIQGIYPASFQVLQASTNSSREGSFKNGRCKFLYNLNII